MLARCWLWVMLAVLPASGCGRSPAASEAARAGSSGARIRWLSDYSSALAEAKKTKRPLLVEFSTTWCSACKRLEETVFSRADVAQLSRKFVAVRVDAEKRADLKKQFRVHSYPTVVFLRPSGEETGRLLGPVPYQIMLEEMGKAAKRAAGRRP